MCVKAIVYVSVQLQGAKLNDPGSFFHIMCGFYVIMLVLHRNIQIILNLFLPYRSFPSANSSSSSLQNPPVDNEERTHLLASETQPEIILVLHLLLWFNLVYEMSGLNSVLLFWSRDTRPQSEQPVVVYLELHHCFETLNNDCLSFGGPHVDWLH